MRKIEQQMVNAIKQGKPFSSGNTTVTIDANTAHVFLHGNHIASVVNGNVMVNTDTLMEYPTRTTKSRLRALGVKVTAASKKNANFLNGEAI